MEEKYQYKNKGFLPVYPGLQTHNFSGSAAGVKERPAFKILPSTTQVGIFSSFLAIDYAFNIFIINIVIYFFGIIYRHTHFF